MIPYTPEELIAIAEREFAWCEAEMKQASREMGFGDDWKKALEKVKTQHVEPGKQPQLIRELRARRSTSSRTHDLVTVPPLAKETWRMEMMSPERQKVNPFFTGGESISVSYPTDTMTHEDKLMSMRGNNIHFSPRHGAPRADPRAPPAGFMADRYNTHRGAFAHAVLDRGLGALLGDAALGPGLPASRPRTASACSSGGCTAAPGSSSRSTSTWGR